MKSSNTLSKSSNKPSQKRLINSSDLKKFASMPVRSQVSEASNQERMQESITDSMRSTPSKGQALNNFPAPYQGQTVESLYRPVDGFKVPTFELLPDSNPVLESCHKEKIVRKDSRSQTTVNTPDLAIAKGGCGNNAQGENRRIKRTKTEVHKLSGNKGNVVGYFHGYSNSLSSNYKNEQIPSRIVQREKASPRTGIQVQEMKFKQEETEKFEPENTSSKSFASYLKNGRRFSIASNGSFNSLGFNEAQFELLSDLTKSVKELNQRLMRNEETTYERLKENISLKNKIKNLESRIEEQQSKRLDTEVLNPGCSSNCQVF